MKEVLTICPSIRPNRLAEMIRSFENTKSVSDLIIDSTPGTTTSIINRIFKENPDYQWYHIANDDFIYHTSGWDKKLQSDGIAYANDGFLKEGLCTISLINGDWARALGWLQLPTVDFLYGDNCFYTLGISLNKLYYFPNVYIEHKHMIKEVFSDYETMKRDLTIEDDVYKKTNSKEQYEKDGQAYVFWCIYEANSDINKIRRLYDTTG